MTCPIDRRARARRLRLGGLALVGVILAGCGASGGSSAGSTGSSTGSASPSTAAAATGAPTPGSPTPGSSTPGSSTTGTAPARVVSGVQVARRVDGFDRPWDLRFLPDGTPLVTERPGRLATVVGGQRRVVAEVPAVVAQGEGGLMGLALHPDFAGNRLVYLCYAHGSSGRVQDVRVVRFRLAEDLSSLTGATPVVTGIPAGAGNRHLGCRVEVGPDGMLWISAGDAVQPDAPQDPTNRAGKVLRATLTGRPAPGNPGGDWDPYVYTRGHRNVQGLAFRPSDGAAFSVEHGTGCDDEINVLRAGADYGWDPGAGGGGRYREDAPMTSPDIPGAVAAAWSSGCPTIAPSGAEFIRGGRWGQWQGHLAVAVLKDQQLLLVGLQGARVTEAEALLSGALGRLRTVRNGPDDSLWLTVDDSPGSLVQVVPTG